MSATAIVSLTDPNALATVFGNRKLWCRNAVAKPSSRYFPTSSPMKPPPLAARFSPLILPATPFSSSVFKRFDTLMEWQECKVKMKVKVPVAVAYGLYSERESIPRWMTFISSVKVMTLFVHVAVSVGSFKFLLNMGNAMDLFFWVGVDVPALLCRGTVRFFPLGPSSCEVELTLAYEVPLLLIPFAAAPCIEDALRLFQTLGLDEVKRSVDKMENDGPQVMGFNLCANMTIWRKTFTINGWGRRTTNQQLWAYTMGICAKAIDYDASITKI